MGMHVCYRTTEVEQHVILAHFSLHWLLTYVPYEINVETGYVHMDAALETECSLTSSANGPVTCLADIVEGDKAEDAPSCVKHIVGHCCVLGFPW